MRNDLNADMASPKDVYSPDRQILISAKGSHIMNTHTPAHAIAETKSISVQKDKFSPRFTRSKASQVKLFSKSNDGKGEVLLIIPNDEYFPPLHFNDSLSGNISPHLESRSQSFLSQVYDSSSGNISPHLESTSQCSVLQSQALDDFTHTVSDADTFEAFAVESISSLPTVPKSDQESIISPLLQ